MLRRLAGLVAVPLMALGLVLATPAGASAAPTPLISSCTATGNIDLPKIIVDQFGNPHFVGTRRYSYVGSVAWLWTYRIWHVTWQSAGSATWSYVEAYAVRCDGDNAIVSTVDLTRTVADKITSNTDLKCGTTNFTVDTSSYTYVGSRFNDGDTFRYWRVSHQSFPLFFVGPTAARCE